MLGTVSTASIIGMAVSFCIAVGLPVCACIFWIRRTRAKGVNVLIGAVTFVLFAMILETLLHQLVLGNTGDAITGNIWLYALYGGTCAGVFEETGRFLAMKFCMKKSLDKKNAIAYGIGHGGIEAVLLIGISMISNIITAVMVNNGQIAATIEALDEPMRETVLSQISALWTTEPYMFYLGGVERISAFFLHVAFSYIVYRAVRDGKPAYYALAVFLHFLVDAGTVLLMEVLPTPVIEALLLATTAGLCFFVYRTYTTEKEPAEIVGER